MYSSVEKVLIVESLMKTCGNGGDFTRRGRKRRECGQKNAAIEKLLLLNSTVSQWPRCFSGRISSDCHGRGRHNHHHDRRRHRRV
ncbi:MAG TPA: hypothetical protein PKA34_32735, partial [Blastocatellia bacterium]|nr:hypothetical protein [Blastocatellia bacterium]